jgi:polypeptide N-acetylgalactosaminyltransferase
LFVGEGGRDVFINESALSPEEHQKYMDGERKNSFNEYASNKISVHRSLPDTRDPRYDHFNSIFS